MSINHQRAAGACEPSPYSTEDFVRFPRRQDGMSNIEADLKRQLAELQKEYQQRAAPIIKQLCNIDAMRPPRTMVIDVSKFDPAILEQIKRNAGVE